MELLQEILSELDPFKQNCNTAAELTHILTQPHFQSLLETHDSVAAQACDSPPPSPCDFVDHEEDEDDDEDDNEGPINNRHPPPDAIRMVGIRKVAGEHLGVTFKVEGGELTIARILHGGMIDQQGLLHVGDVIKEVNGREVGQDARVLQEELQATSGSVVLKVLPSYHEAIPPRKVFFKCHYDYDPAHDNLIPCKEAGLRFKSGDILQIVNQDDVNWWQALHVEGGSAGLIPSQMLEEKRKAFVKRDVELPPAGNLCTGAGGKKKKKVMYVTTKNAEFDRHEILLYEEVAKVPPFKRKTLVLIGAQGVGRRRLKNKMLLRDPLLFGTTIPYTSRKPKKEDKESRMFGFTSRSKMEVDIKSGRFLEHGEYDGNLYGIKMESIHEVVEAGRVCVLDVNPQSLKVLRTSDFLPYVVFLQAPDFEVLKAMNQSAVEAEVVTKTLTGGVCRDRLSLRAEHTGNRMEVLKVLLVLVPLLQRSECVRCFARFDLGRCDEELGEVDEDDCCLNPHNGFQATGGVCQSCGPPVWSPWSPWSECSVLCGDGVTMRSRKCFGIGDCEDADNLQTIPCNNTCCNGEGWAPWLSWSSCSVTCAGGGVRSRERKCSAPLQCLSSCSGASQETEACPTLSTCPVHGGWALWSDWSLCSGSCIDVAVPTRRRHRSCSSPAPSSDTAPQGTACPGDPLQSESCSHLPNCPVDGGWGAWSQPGPCSVSCGEGLQLSIRTCDSPAPKYGGRFCDGPSTKSIVCQSPCPVDGFWSGWSVWGECSSSCIPEGQSAVRTRHRSCSNPAPSSSPPGNSCSGEDMETDTCMHLPHCSVDGGWGSWSEFSPCPVTCGVGLQLSVRRCDSPAPKHGGQPCAGGGSRTSVCNTNEHCPVDGLWSQWSQWAPCRDPFRGKDIRCLKIGGSQSRERSCLHRAHDGSICSGEALTETRVCYDVDKCYMKGSWDGWEQWSLCSPPCGGKPQRFRRRFCKPDYSDYRPTIGRQKAKATFFGKPQADCRLPPEGGLKLEIQPCLNVPACP